MVIRGILFDFDGTLTAPGSLDFNAIRQEIGCPAGQPILEFIRGLPSGPQRDRAREILDAHETAAAARSLPNEGAEELLRLLRARDIRTGILSRNSRASILRALENFTGTRPSDFSAIVSRDDPIEPKPSPEGIRAAARQMDVPAESLLVVGDFVFDIEAGYGAGAPTAYLTNGESGHVAHEQATFTIARLEELESIVRLHSALPAGKLPNDLLEEFLAEFRREPGSLLLAPAVGQDVAAVELAGGEAMVLKSDPITFATDSIGCYSVAVSANDIATSGARARWLLTTLLLPAGTTAAQVRDMMRELHAAARAHGMEVCGGHTEVTDAVTRPVVVTQAVGIVPVQRLIGKGDIATGDLVLLTKGLAIEGTSILAREFGARLRDRGASEALLARCRAFLQVPGISILKEAYAAADAGGVTAMHDITEGGLATALDELSLAGGHRIRVYRSRIVVLEETRQVCDLMAIDPLGLIGSGSLLITCKEDRADDVIRSVTRSGVEVTCIGEVLGPGHGVEAVTEPGGAPISWPRFLVDEIARVFREFGPSHK